MNMRSFAPFLALLLLLGGCASIRNAGELGNGLDASGNPLYLSPEAQQKEIMENFLTDYSNPDDSLKIEYLLTVIERSPYTFVRNGQRADGEDAMQWLRWKMHHKQYADCPILTPDDFVDRVADISRNSGLPYEVIYPDNHREKLQAILRHELDAFQARLGRK